MALWGGRFSKKLDQDCKKFNDSLHFDYRLAEQDILGSIAWSKVLVESNVLNLNEQCKIELALYSLLKEIKQNSRKILTSNSEDIHSWVEHRLIDMLGDLGKKLHTGRSRNDQIATDLRLWCKVQCKNITKSVIHLQKELVKKAELTQKAIMPGYTHLQRAQPITFAHWCLAYVEMLKRDESRLNDVLKRINVSPLGCGAISGTSWSVNRDKLAINMGFSSATKNSLDSVSDRDYVIELLSVASISMIHLSQFSTDLIFFNSNEANFIEFSDSVTFGSSLMPQKKNPDLLELVRAKCGRVHGSLMAILIVLKGLPLAYNKDLQEDKEGLFDALDTWDSCLKIVSIILNKFKVNYSFCEYAANEGYLNATELADYLVKKGISFRNAHNIVGKIVLEAIKQKKQLNDLELSTFKKYSNVIDDNVYKCLKLESYFEKRNSKGGVSFENVQKEIFYLKKQLGIS